MIKSYILNDNKNDDKTYNCDKILKITLSIHTL